MKVNRFYKDSEGWFIDLPSFPGPKSALALIQGADVMLDVLSKNTNEVVLTFHHSPVDDCDVVLNRKEIIGLGLCGADYVGESSNKSLNSLDVWLCPVTVYVFGTYPPKIYVKVN
jgi:hypothetical protein